MEGLTKELVGLIGPAGSDAIKQMLDAAGTAQPHGWAGLVGIAVLLFATTGFVGSLQDALDKIWDAPARPDGVWSFLRNKLFSFSLVLAAARSVPITTKVDSVKHLVLSQVLLRPDR